MVTAPSKIKLHRRSQTLELTFAPHTEPSAGKDGNKILPGLSEELGAEFLRVHSPSAEVKGHGPGQEVLQLNKQGIAITGIEAQGNYAIKIFFSDGHDSGLYTWQYLYNLAQNKERLWQDYLDKVKKHEESKDLQTVKWISPP